MSHEQLLEVVAQIKVENGDDEELDRLARQLLSEIQELDVDSVKLAPADSVPQGAKVIDTVLIGTVLVSVGPLVLTKLLELLHDWAVRREGRTVKLKMRNQAGASVEIEVPASMQPSEVKSLISAVNETLVSGKRKN